MKELLEKIKSINYKSKKAIISYIVAFVVLLSGTGITAVALNNQNHNIIENNSTSEDNHSSTISDKETSDETNKEENSKEENSNLSDNNSSNNSNSSNSTNQSNSSADTNTANSTNNKPSNNNNTTSKPSKPSNSTNTSNNNTNNNKPTQPEQPKPHTHTWVHYNEQGHYEKVLVKDSWTELVPKYETQIFTVCNACDWVVASPDKPFNEAEYNNHMNAHLDNYENAGHHNETRQVQVGVDKIEHPAEYKDEWIVDTPAYDQCSGCGERK